jgi:hypothetical protein
MIVAAMLCVLLHAPRLGMISASWQADKISTLSPLSRR